jgi:hypothetical protein
MCELSCDDNLKFYGHRSRAVWSDELAPPDHVETSVDLKGRGDMSKRPPPTREQLLAMIAHSSWEKKVALCVIILLNRDPAQDEGNREVAVDVLQQLGRLLDELQVPKSKPLFGMAT